MKSVCRSIGCVLLELCVGKPCFSGANRIEMVQAQVPLLRALLRALLLALLRALLRQ